MIIGKIGIIFDASLVLRFNFTSLQIGRVNDTLLNYKVSIAELTGLLTASLKIHR
jgi:hypothetical protein